MTHENTPSSDTKPRPTEANTLVLTTGEDLYLFYCENHGDTVQAKHMRNELQNEEAFAGRMIARYCECPLEVKMHDSQNLPSKLRTKTIGSFMEHGVLWYIDHVIGYKPKYRNPLNYRHIGIRDSETEGWSEMGVFREGGVETPTSAIEISTGDMILTCSVLVNQDKPGFIIKAADFDGRTDIIKIRQEGSQLVILTDEDSDSDSTLRFRFAREIPKKK